MPDTEGADETKDDLAPAELDQAPRRRGHYQDADYYEADDTPTGRRYRPGRGGFDPEAAAETARAKYKHRQRVVVGMLLLAVGTAVVAGFAIPMVWWGHGAIDLALVGYLTYLRRQVRIEEEVRERRLARMSGARQPESLDAEPEDDQYEADQDLAETPVVATSCTGRQGAVAVEIDDEDPSFVELEGPAPVTYRRAVGE